MAKKVKAVIVKGYPNQKTRDEKEGNSRTGKLIARCTTEKELTRAGNKVPATHSWLNYFTETGKPLKTRSVAKSYLAG